MIQRWAAPVMICILVYVGLDRIEEAAGLVPALCAGGFLLVCSFVWSLIDSEARTTLRGVAVNLRFTPFYWTLHADWDYTLRGGWFIVGPIGINLLIPRRIDA